MSKEIKQMIMDELQEQLGDVQELLVVDTSKLDGVTSNRFRIGLREQELSALCIKNSLALKTLRDAGVDGMEQVLSGPSTLVWGGEDIVALSKAIAKWAKDLEDLSIKGGSVEGTAVSAAQVDALSKSPGRLELLSIISGQLLSPGAQISGALLGAGAKLASQIEKIGEGEETEAA